MPTILITGTSTGIGKATAKYFANKGWNVVATMRKPDLETELTKISNITVLPLDVTDLDSIQKAIDLAIKQFGTIDAIVNNAGFAVSGPFETATQEQINKQFATNIYGVFDCTRAILPHFRSNKAGIIVNVTSMGGRFSFPYYSLYNTTKWAIDGFSESLQYELGQLNIKVKIIEPGAIKTDFYSRSQTSSINNSLNDSATNAYREEFAKIKIQFDKAGSSGSDADIVAKTIYKSVTDNTNKLRYTVGVDAKIILFLKWLLPNRLLFKYINFMLSKTK